MLSPHICCRTLYGSRIAKLFPSIANRVIALQRGNRHDLSVNAEVDFNLEQGPVHAALPHWMLSAGCQLLSARDGNQLRLSYYGITEDLNPYTLFSGKLARTIHMSTYGYSDCKFFRVAGKRTYHHPSFPSHRRESRRYWLGQLFAGKAIPSNKLTVMKNSVARNLQVEAVGLDGTTNRMLQFFEESGVSIHHTIFH